MFIKYFNEYDNKLILIPIQYTFIITVKNNNNKVSVYLIFFDFLLIFLAKLIKIIAQKLEITQKSLSYFHQ